jgi:hypothetical protein
MATTPEGRRRRKNRRDAEAATTVLDLPDHLFEHILLRLGPSPCLVRAAAACRSWRGILSDPAFASEYRALHGAPPMLGFLYDERYTDDWPFHGDYWVSHFVSTASFRSPACEDRQHWRVLDSRHGLVLFYTPTLDAQFVVCDLVAGDQWEIHADPKCYTIMWWEHDEAKYKYASIHCNAAVFCAKDRCDHLDCHGGPFRIALVGSVEDGSVSYATVYSSETGEWSDISSVQNPNYINGRGHSAVVGNKVYVPCLESDSVVEYNIGEQQLSEIDAPFEDQDQNQPYIELMGVEGGMLLFASVVDARLYLWSMEAGPNRAENWARRSVIELEPLLPPPALFDVSVVGFAEGVGVIFLNTKAGLYTIELNSGQSKKVHMSFYTRGTI